MTDALVDVLAQRAHEPKGLRRMVTISYGVHVGVILAALVVSRAWLVAEKPPAKLMTVTLSAGAEGPKSTGMTALGAKPVEQVAPPPKRPEPIKPVPPKNDAMTVPAKPKPEPKPEFKPKSIEPPKPAPERAPTTGREVTKGTSRVETNTKSQETGLSTGGTLGGAQDVMQIDPEFKFCCQAYVDSMCEIIQRYWNKDQHINGDVILQFTIRRDGTVNVADIKTEKAFNSSLERFAKSAIDTSQKMGGFGKLPDEFKGDKLVVHLRFPYIR